MKILNHLGFTPITMSEFLDYKERRNSIPKKPIIITFDDGLEDSIENSVPILDNYGFKAVYYIPTAFVGTKSRWLQRDIGAQFQLADWSRIKELDRCGHEIGAHSKTHPHLNTLPPEECYCELKDSRETLEEALGHRVEHLAYPYGDFDDITKNIAHETGYLTASTTELSIADLNDDLLSLPRLNIGMEDNLLDFVTKIYSSYTVTGILNTSKYRAINTVPRPAKNLIKKLINYRKSK